MVERISHIAGRMKTSRMMFLSLRISNTRENADTIRIKSNCPHIYTTIFYRVNMGCSQILLDLCRSKIPLAQIIGYGYGKISDPAEIVLPVFVQPAQQILMILLKISSGYIAFVRGTILEDPVQLSVEIVYVRPVK